MTAPNREPVMNTAEMHAIEHLAATYLRNNEEWEDIRQTVDGSYDKFSVRLLEAFPGLSMKDVYFCCLVKINVSIKDLSDIYCISRTSISRKKQRMKRDKLGLTENNETLDDFLRRF